MASSGGPEPLELSSPASARASSAQRASWNARRRSPAGAARPAPAGSSDADLARDARADPLGEPERLVLRPAPVREQRARERAGAGREPARRLVAHGGGQRLLDLGLDRARRLQHEHADAVAEPERLEPPRQVGAGQLAGHQRGQQVAGQPALGVVGHAAAQQLERHDRDRLVQRQAVELGRARRRPWPPPARRAGGRPAPRCRWAACARRAAPARGPRARRPARSRGAPRRGCGGAARRAAPRPCRRRARWRCVRRTSSSPRASKISAGPPISEASASATPSSPRSDSTIRSSRSCAESARWSTA